MTWDYRVVQKHTYHGKCLGDVVEFGIHETYYNDDGKPTMISTDIMPPYGETFEELRNDLEHMIIALGKPVLNWEDFKNKEVSIDTETIGCGNRK